MKRFTVPRPSPAAHAAALALLLVAASALNAGRAAAADAEPIVFAVNARVVDGTGWPIENVPVTVAGTFSASGATGTNGRALLRVPIGTPAEIAAHTVELTVEAGEKKPAYALTDGSAALRIEIASTGQVLTVRSSSTPMTVAVARMLRTSEGRSIAIELLFLATPPSGVKKVAALGPGEDVALTGSQATAAPVNPALPASAQQRSLPAADTTRAARVEPPHAKSTPQVPATKSPTKSVATATSPSKPVAIATSPAPSPTPKPTPGLSAAPSSPTPNLTPQPPVVGTVSQTTRTMPHAISTPSDEVPVINAPRPQRENEKECRCRVTGSVEVNWDRPLSRPLYVRVSLLDQPSVHDSLTLFMGSPRGFVLDDVACGAHRVLVTLPGREPFVVATPESGLLFTCERSWLKPMRVVLVRR